ncbi:DUF397 domain-containing protein [Streptomyces natalensis]|uniref:DUF397 domain-containing protein n=1 Tax=Streptomyces natalensis ATCC 27448 TaxID=1240678 RepID=A0A0D7CSL1_9ACTN|nr:DUF397 domain-containing protein [Streptomyces natalensis]KIZ19051.1 hypothetical protein SNA_04855 [Streptomyces natalensis ATCC 27448]
MPAADHRTDNLHWFKSSYSGGAGSDCIEIADLHGRVAVRDSKDPDGPVLAFPTPGFAAFVEGVRGTN